MVAKAADAAVAGAVFLVKLRKVLRGEAEEGYLACRDEARAEKQYDDNAESNPYAKGRHMEADLRN